MSNSLQNLYCDYLHLNIYCKFKYFYIIGSAYLITSPDTLLRIRSTCCCKVWTGNF